MSQERIGGVGRGQVALTADEERIAGLTNLVTGFVVDERCLFLVHQLKFLQRGITIYKWDKVESVNSFLYMFKRSHVIDSDAENGIPSKKRS